MKRNVSQSSFHEKMKDFAVYFSKRLSLLNAKGAVSKIHGLCNLLVMFLLYVG
jgi:hypothetical protein